MNKHVLILSTMHMDITIANNAKKHRKQFPLIMTQSTELILLTKCLKNTLAALAHEDGRYIL